MEYIASYQGRDAIMTYRLFRGKDIKGAAFLKVTSEIPMGSRAAEVASLPDSSPQSLPPGTHTLLTLFLRSASVGLCD